MWAYRASVMWYLEQILRQRKNWRCIEQPRGSCQRAKRCSKLPAARCSNGLWARLHPLHWRTYFAWDVEQFCNLFFTTIPLWTPFDGVIVRYPPKPGNVFRDQLKTLLGYSRFCEALSWVAVSSTSTPQHKLRMIHTRSKVVQNCIHQNGPGTWKLMPIGRQKIMKRTYWPKVPWGVSSLSWWYNGQVS